MRAIEFLTEAERPGFLSRAATGLGTLFGKSSSVGKMDVEKNYRLGWTAFERWRGQKGIEFGVLTVKDVLDKFKVNGKADPVMLKAAKELGLNAKSTLDQQTAQNLVYTYSKNITTGEGNTPNPFNLDNFVTKLDKTSANTFIDVLTGAAATRKNSEKQAKKVMQTLKLHDPKKYAIYAKEIENVAGKPGSLIVEPKPSINLDDYLLDLDKTQTQELINVINGAATATTPEIKQVVKSLRLLTIKKPKLAQKYVATLAKMADVDPTSIKL
jgi:hypothetical protein